MANKIGTFREQKQISRELAKIYTGANTGFTMDSLINALLLTTLYTKEELTDLLLISVSKKELYRLDGGLYGFEDGIEPKLTFGITGIQL